jgi:hypothetical protein
MFNKIVIAFTFFMLLFSVSCSASAQGKKAAPVKNAKNTISINKLVQMAREGRSAADPEIAKMVKNAYSEAQSTEANFFGNNDITGTWICDVAASTAGNAPFSALQTFNSDGTFVETSSLLGYGGEGPAHGVYVRFVGGYVLTFELFVFDPETGDSVGRVRVRNFIRMQGQNKLISYNAVDFIEPDGNEIPDIDSGIYTADRMRVRGL